jgi:hypothetical protein
VDPPADRIFVYLTSELNDRNAATAVLAATRGCGWKAPAAGVCIPYRPPAAGQHRESAALRGRAG